MLSAVGVLRAVALVTLSSKTAIFEKDAAFAVLSTTPLCSLDEPILPKRQACLVLPKLAATRFL